MGLIWQVKKAIRAVRRTEGTAHESAGPVSSQLTNGEFSLTARDIARLIEAAGCQRDKVLIRLLAETGMRRHEAAALADTDIDCPQLLITIRSGKGRKQRMVPMTPQLADDLRRLLLGQPPGRIFQSRQTGSLSTRQVNRIVKAASRVSGIHHPNPKYREVTCHLLRHTFARLWKAHQGSIETLSKILGHASVQTTWDIYGTEGLRDIQINYAVTVAAMFGSDVRLTKRPNRR
jgi:integrase